MEIFGREIGGGYPTFVVAEAGVNHNGDMGLARQLIDIAVQAGVDAVKFQTLNASAYISKYAPKAQYQLEATDRQESQVDMVRKYELSKAQHISLMEYCAKVGMPFFSTAFDRAGVDLLDALGVEVFKIPSGEITNIPLIEYIASKRKPIILSTGMSFLGEVERAVGVILNGGVESLFLLHCISNYPAQPGDVNLRAMYTMQKAFGLPVGYSDHTQGIEIAVAAVALGACIIEKHYTVDRKLPGPDHRASLEPRELKALVTAIRNVEDGLGNGIKCPMSSEKNTRDVARKSLVASRFIKAGSVLTEKEIAAKRPGTGISPTEIQYVLGRKVMRDVEEDELFDWEMIA